MAFFKNDDDVRNIVYAGLIFFLATMISSTYALGQNDEGQHHQNLAEEMITIFPMETIDVEFYNSQKKPGEKIEKRMLELKGIKVPMNEKPFYGFIPLGVTPSVSDALDRMKSEKKFASHNIKWWMLVDSKVNGKDAFIRGVFLRQSLPSTPQVQQHIILTWNPTQHAPVIIVLNSGPTRQIFYIYKINRTNSDIPYPFSIEKRKHLFKDGRVKGRVKNLDAVFEYHDDDGYCGIKRMEIMNEKKSFLIFGERGHADCPPMYFRYYPEKNKLYRVDLKEEKREELENQMQQEEENNSQK